MRADRLVATTLYLQRHGRVTAAALADHLEVSVATARRDLEALSAAGVPVYPQPGRGGGWQLVGGARTDLTGLTEPEVRALFLALGPVAGSASTALTKLVHALPEPFRAQAWTAAAAQRSEPRRWEDHAPAPVDDHGLRRAILDRRRCRLRYRGRAGTRTVVVDPWRLVDRAGVGYLLAGTEAGPRTYRLDRMDAVEITDEPGTRPSDGEIEAHWQATVDVVVEARTRVRARVRADPEALELLARHLGAAAVHRVAADEAWVAAHSERGLAEQLAGWGARVVVLEPEGVRAHLRTIAAELAATYPTPGFTALSPCEKER